MDHGKLATEDPFDPERLRLPAGRIGESRPSRRPPQHRPGEPFLKGPIPYEWIAAACRLPGSGLHVATMFRFLNCRYRGANRWGLEAVAKELRISSFTARRGLHAAELAGLLTVDREPGCKLSVSILNHSGPDTGPRRPLYGPIPWNWWRTALRLDGPALRTATACWLIAGWERAAEFELALGGWDDLGSSRFAMGRGVEYLEAAGLVNVVKRRGRSPIVTLLHGPGSPTGDPDGTNTGATPGV